MDGWSGKDSVDARLDVFGKCFACGANVAIRILACNSRGLDSARNDNEDDIKGFLIYLFIYLFLSFFLLG